MSFPLPKAREWTFSEIAVGQSWVIERTFSDEDLEKFAYLSGDFNPFHVDSSYAATTEVGSCVVHGMLLASLFSQLVGMWLPGKHALYLGQDLSFRRPVLRGETVKASARVTGKSEATRTLTLATEIHNAEGKLVVTGTAKVKVRDSSPIPLVASPPIRSRGSSNQRVALITGGSRGIGAEIARTLARRNVKVAVNYFRSADNAHRVVHDIREAGAEAFAVQADVRNSEAVQEMVSTVMAQFGRLDWVVNSAIGELQHKSFMELDWDCFHDFLEYEVKAVLQVMKAVHPLMKAGGGGAVVNILSQVTFGQPPARMADYVTGKYALYGLSKALASEWAEDKIRVNMVSPSLTQTDLTVHYPERLFALEANRTPLKRTAQPKDIASAVAYLLSEEASFLTGINMFVTGGQVMI